MKATAYEHYEPKKSDDIIDRVKKCLSNTFINYRIKRCLDDKYIITLEYKNKTISGTICGYEIDHIEDFVERLKRSLLKKIKESDNMSKVGLKTFKFEGPIEINTEFGCPIDWNEIFLYEPYTPKRKMKREPYKYIINKGATILFWDSMEKEKTIVKLSKNDKYDKRLGFLIAYFQYNSGLSKTQANKYLDNLVEEDKKGSK